MRYTVIVCLLLLSSIQASAKCGGGGIYPLSKSTQLNPTGVIVLEFYASSQDLVAELNKKYPAFLRSGSEKVTLEVIEVLKGEFMVTQVILKPTSLLHAGKIYSMYIDKLPRHERSPRNFNNEQKKWTAIQYTVVETKENDLPVWSDEPAEINKSMVSYGCGPARWVHFTIPNCDNRSGLFIRASVKNKTSGKTTDFILPVENGQVMIGHGMCSGPFLLEKELSYEVRFMYWNPSGGQGEATRAIAFTAPALPAKGR